MDDSRYRVLVVDDEPGMLEVLSETLSRQDDLEVMPELYSTVALQRLRDEPFDLLITNLKMARVSGLKLLRLCHDERPELPVLVVTGYPEARSAAECRRLGAVAYLTKPFLPEELVGAARRALREQGERHARAS